MTSEKGRKYLYAFELVILAGPSIVSTVTMALIGLFVSLCFVPFALLGFVSNPTTEGLGVVLLAFSLLGMSSALGTVALALLVFLSTVYLSGKVASLRDKWPLYLACLALAAVPFAFLGWTWWVTGSGPTGFLDGNVYRDVFLWALPILIPLTHLGIEMRLLRRLPA